MAEPDPRRPFAVTCVAGLLGAAVLAAGAAQPWATATTRSPAVRTVSATGSDVAPLAVPLALVALAAWGTVLVLRRRARRAAAVLGALASAGAGAAVVAGFGDAGTAAARLLDGEGIRAHATAWPYAALAGAVLATGAFAVAWVRAPGWPEMSRRYDAPGAVEGGTGTEAPRGGADLWKALDEGHDPTL